MHEKAKPIEPGCRAYVLAGGREVNARAPNASPAGEIVVPLEKTPFTGKRGYYFWHCDNDWTIAENYLLRIDDDDPDQAIDVERVRERVE